MSVEQQNDWQKYYQAALLELDPTKLPERIEQAHKAIEMTMEVARQDSNATERQALADALANLRVLRREVGLPICNPNDSEPASSASKR